MPTQFQSPDGSAHNSRFEQQFRRQTPDKQNALFRAFLDRVEDTIDDICERVAKRSAEEVRRGIKRNHPRKKPLSAEYAAWKKKNVRGKVPLVASGEYVEHIEARAEDGGWYVGPAAGKHKCGLTYEKIGRYHEFGTLSGIPARPHFRPVHAFARVELKREVDLMIGSDWFKRKGQA